MRSVDYTTPTFRDPRDEPMCDERGPRIGEDGCPRCRRPVGHAGPHRPDMEDGWGPISWARWEDVR